MRPARTACIIACVIVLPVYNYIIACVIVLLVYNYVIARMIVLLVYNYIIARMIDGCHGTPGPSSRGPETRSRRRGRDSEAGHGEPPKLRRPRPAFGSVYTIVYIRPVTASRRRGH